jgi:F-type H+-transporting ATPase subunit epsilon
MHVLVISPEASKFDGVADSVVVPVYDGEVGILPNHAPFVAPLGRGVLTVRSQGQVTRFRVAGGFLQVISNTVRVVAEQIEGVSHAA